MPAVITPSPSEPKTALRIGTRSSALAIAQVDLFVKLLRDTTPDLQASVHPSTSAPGDTDKSTPLHTLASQGKSLWTADLEAPLLAHEIDCIVHSLKDVPTKLPPGCEILVVGDREERRDCLALNRRKYRWEGNGSDDKDENGYGSEDDGASKPMIKRLGDLPPGTVIGTSSVRRTAMLRRHYPHLKTRDIRGNVGTRLRKLDGSATSTTQPPRDTPTQPSTSTATPSDPQNPPPTLDSTPEFDALILASAGLARLSLHNRIACLLPASSGLLPAVGQGALGVEIRTEDLDTWIGSSIKKCVNSKVAWCAIAERAMLRVLEGGCSVPVGVDTSWVEEYGEEHEKSSGVGNQDPPQAVDNNPSSDRKPRMEITASVTSLDGSDSIEGTLILPVSSDEEADGAGMQMARDLIGKGAEMILREITLNRTRIEEEGGA